MRMFWNNSPVTVNLAASGVGGSGVSQLRYWVDSTRAEAEAAEALEHR
jgi:hypothetical protein